jgi:hypothetical protein
MGAVKTANREAPIVRSVSSFGYEGANFALFVAKLQQLFAKPSEFATRIRATDFADVEPDRDFRGLATAESARC